jgi:hypothetical protein
VGIPIRKELFFGISPGTTEGGTSFVPSEIRKKIGSIKCAQSYYYFYSFSKWIYALGIVHT